MQRTFRNGVATTVAGVGIDATCSLGFGAVPPSAAPPRDALQSTLLSGRVLPEVPPHVRGVISSPPAPLTVAHLRGWGPVFGWRRRSAGTDQRDGGLAWRDHASTR